MFNETKYTKWYFEIVDAARTQNRRKGASQYFESHHVIPRSLGGTDEKDNLVLLTAREHFLAHWLLTKMVEGEFRQKMIFALNFMANGCKSQRTYTTKQYEVARKLVSETVADRNKGTAYHKGKTHSAATKAIMSERKKGINLSDNHKAKIRKTYSFMTPFGEILTTSNLSEFCKEHGLYYQNMSKLSNGTYNGPNYKGWSAA